MPHAHKKGIVITSSSYQPFRHFQYLLRACRHQVEKVGRCNHVLSLVKREETSKLESKHIFRCHNAVVKVYRKVNDVRFAVNAEEIILNQNRKTECCRDPSCSRAFLELMPS